MHWFKHFSGMRHDPKIKRVISRFGLEGYGLYCLVLESITQSLSKESPLPVLEENCEDIADFYNGDTAKVNEMMAFMINQGLFNPDELTGQIICHKIYSFLDSAQTRSIEIREMIKNYKQNLVTDCHGLSQTVNDNTDRIDKSRIDKSREDRTEHQPGVYLTDTQYNKLITEYGKKDVDYILIAIAEYQTRKGDYKDHYLTALKWLKKDHKDTPGYCPKCGSTLIDGACNCGGCEQ